MTGGQTYYIESDDTKNTFEFIVYIEDRTNMKTLSIPQVTIIIPVHNSEKYLKECIESALTQSYKDIEVLCIDGGSTDNSVDIIKQLQKKDTRIHFLYDTNTSYGHKINLGINNAKGKYISVLESDDKMEPDMIEKLYHIAEKFDTDITDADYYEFINLNAKELRSVCHKYKSEGEYGHLVQYSDTSERYITTSGMWTGLYKKDFLLSDKIYLNESPGASYQDTSFMFLTSLLAQKVYHIDLPLYAYRVDNENSSVKDDKKIFEVVGEFEFLKNDLENRNIKDDVTWNLYYTRKYTVYYWNCCRLSMKAREKFLEKYTEELKIDIKNGKISRDAMSAILYTKTYLLLDDKNKFLKTCPQKPALSLLVNACKVLEQIDEEEVILFGAGRSHGVQMHDFLIRFNKKVNGICDNSSALHEKYIGNLKIMPVEQTCQKFPDALYCITGYRDRYGMKNQLLSEGIPEENIILLFP